MDAHVGMIVVFVLLLPKPKAAVPKNNMPKPYTPEGMAVLLIVIVCATFLLLFIH
jgi:hypothetical protein